MSASPSSPGATPVRPDHPGGTVTERPGLAPRTATRITQVRHLPPRWFPADKDKLVYLAVAAHVDGRVLGQLAALRPGVRYEDRRALVRAVEAATAQLG